MLASAQLQNLGSNIAVLEFDIWTNTFPPTNLWDLKGVFVLFSQRRKQKAVCNTVKDGEHHFSDSIENPSTFFKIPPIFDNSKEIFCDTESIWSIETFPTWGTFQYGYWPSTCKQLK